MTHLTRFTRWSGLASMLGGLLFGIGIPLHPLRDGEAVNRSPYSAIHVLIAVGLLLTLFGLVGLYIRQAEHPGAPQPTAFGLAFLGNALAYGGIMSEGFLWPAVGRYDPAAVHSFDPHSAVASVTMLLTIVFLGGLLLFAIGYGLFGRATMRAGILPSGGSALIAVGAVLYAAGGFSLAVFGPHALAVTVIETSGAIPFGAGFIWLGYALWAGAGPSRHPVPERTTRWAGGISENRPDRS